MIVALARKLLIALWRFAKDGVIPEGAAMRGEREGRRGEGGEEGGGEME